VRERECVCERERERNEGQESDKRVESRRKEGKNKGTEENKERKHIYIISPPHSTISLS